MLPIIIKIETCFYYACILEEKKKIELIINKISEEQLSFEDQILFLDKFINTWPILLIIKSYMSIEDYISLTYNINIEEEEEFILFYLINIQTEALLKLELGNEYLEYLFLLFPEMNVEDILYIDQEIDLLEYEINIKEQDIIIVEPEIDFENFLEEYDDDENFLIDVILSEKLQKQRLINLWIKKERNGILFLEEQKQMIFSLMNNPFFEIQKEQKSLFFVFFNDSFKEEKGQNSLLYLIDNIIIYEEFIKQKEQILINLWIKKERNVLLFLKEQKDFYFCLENNIEQKEENSFSYLINSLKEEKKKKEQNSLLFLTDNIFSEEQKKQKEQILINLWIQKEQNGILFLEEQKSFLNFMLASSKKF